jgi:type IV secretion system protein VirB9
VTRLGGAAGRLLRLSILPLALALLLPRPAAAEVTPRPSRHDPRVRTVAYHPMIPVRIVTSPTSSTQIILAPEEEITHVALGDPDHDAWLALPVGNLLFVKPLLVRFVTNAQIVTRRPDGRRRSYQLVLVPNPPGTGGRDAAMFAVSFTYPQDAADAAAAERARTLALNTERAVQARLAGSWAEGPRNWRYLAQGSTALEPSEVSDNGRTTAFRFPGNRRLPVIYTLAPDGQETLVPYALHGDVAVVQAAAAAFVLRDGAEVLRVLNRGFDPVGRDPGTGTGTPDLTRFVRGAGP